MSLLQADILKPANTGETGYALADRKTISGCLTVENLDALYAIYDYLMSPSKDNTNDDAIGFTVYVRSEGKHYVLKDWENRKTAEGWGELSGGGVQSDWSQNDETSNDYIKNRTHYVIEGDGEMHTVIEIQDAEYEYSSVNGSSTDAWELSILLNDGTGTFQIPSEGKAAKIIVGDYVTFDENWKIDDYGDIYLGDNWDDYSSLPDWKNAYIYKNVYTGEIYLEIYFKENSQVDSVLYEGDKRNYTTTFQAESEDTFVKLNDNYLNIENFTDEELIELWDNSYAITL